MKNADNVCDVKLSSYYLYYRGFFALSFVFLCFDSAQGKNLTFLLPIECEILKCLD